MREFVFWSSGSVVINYGKGLKKLRKVLHRARSECRSFGIALHGLTINSRARLVEAAIVEKIKVEFTDVNRELKPSVTIIGLLL